MHRVSPIEGKTLGEILDTVIQPTLLCGDVSEPEVMRLAGRERELVVAGPAASLRRAGFLAEIGWRRFQSGQVEDPAQVDAIYLTTST